MTDVQGAAILRVDVAATALFTVSATLAAGVFDDVTKVQGVVVSLVLFAAGVGAFVGGYWSALRKSRTSRISVAELFFLVGRSTPARVKRIMNGCLIMQSCVALATAVARGSTPGTGADGSSSPGSTLAFGVLVPVLGLGLNGLWAARHGDFPSRVGPE